MTFCKQIFSFLSLASVLVVAACGYSSDSNSQKVTFLAPNEQGAQCLVSVGDREYNVSLPETLDVKVSENGMHLLCNTNDNRALETVVSPDVTTRAVWGGANAGDYASDSTYKYPSVVSVDFPQVKSLEDAGMLAKDDQLLNPVDLDAADGVMSEGNGGEVISNDSTVIVDEPADLQAVIDDLSNSDEDNIVNESHVDTKAMLEAETHPVSIYPGQ